MRYAQQYDAMVAYLDALLRAKTVAEAELVRSKGVRGVPLAARRGDLTSSPQAYRDAVSSVVFLSNRKYASWCERLPARLWREWAVAHHRGRGQAQNVQETRPPQPTAPAPRAQRHRYVRACPSLPSALRMTCRLLLSRSVYVCKEARRLFYEPMLEWRRALAVEHIPALRRLLWSTKPDYEVRGPPPHA